MIKTNKINPEINKERKKLTNVTTKNINASVDVKKPKEPIKTTSMTTNKVGDPTEVEDRLKRQRVLKKKEEYKKKIEAKERMAKARAARKKKGNKK